MIITTATPPACATCGADADLTAKRAGDGINARFRPFCRPCWQALPVDEWGNTGWIEANLYTKEHPMPAPDTTTLADRLAPLAAELARLAADKADIEAREKEVKAQIRALVPGPDKYAAGDLTVTVSANHRFDARTAERVLPPELLDLCRIAKVDSAAAKEVLPPALYQQCMVDVGEYRVAIR